MFLALSCLQGRPNIAAFDELATLAHDLGGSIRLTPGNLPDARRRAAVGTSRQRFDPASVGGGSRRSEPALRAVKLVASRHCTPAAVGAEHLSRDGQLVT
ncbi:MAG: hypothetical protein ABJE66_30555 [Deltaproteobacteria bacterium]